MNRREFLAFSTGSLLLTSQLFAESLENEEMKILTGRVSPILFGINERLQKEAFEHYKKMQESALKAQVKLFSVSSYRNFNSQLRIWNGKYDTYTKQGLKNDAVIKKIIEYSAFPGASRHHWGTDLDIFDINCKQPADPLHPKHYTGNGIYSKMYTWMQENSEKFGFYEVYTKASNRKGFNFEPWHYSYKNISQNYLHNFLKVDFKKDIKSNLIKGNQYIDQKFWDMYLENYVKGINPILL